MHKMADHDDVDEEEVERDLSADRTLRIVRKLADIIDFGGAFICLCVFFYATVKFFYVDVESS